MFQVAGAMWIVGNSSDRFETGSINVSSGLWCLSHMANSVTMLEHV